MPGIKGQVQDLYSWIRRRPQPEVLVAHCADGVKRLPKPHGNKPWRDWIDTVMKVDPLRVEAIDKDGSILRVADLSMGGDEDAVLGPAGQVTTDAGNRTQSTLVVLAGLLSESYTRAMNAFQLGAEMARSSSEAQTAHLLEMMTLQMQRVTVLERFVTQSHIHAIAQIEEARQLAAERADTGEEGGGMLEQMAANFLPGLMAGQQARATTAKPPAPKPPKPTANGAPDP